MHTHAPKQTKRQALEKLAAFTKTYLLCWVFRALLEFSMNKDTERQAGSLQKH